MRKLTVKLQRTPNDALTVGSAECAEGKRGEIKKVRVKGKRPKPLRYPDLVLEDVPQGETDKYLGDFLVMSG